MVSSEWEHVKRKMDPCDDDDVQRFNFHYMRIRVYSDDPSCYKGNSKLNLYQKEKIHCLVMILRPNEYL